MGNNEEFSTIKSRLPDFAQMPRKSEHFQIYEVEELVCGKVTGDCKKT